MVNVFSGVTLSHRSPDWEGKLLIRSSRRTLSRPWWTFTSSELKRSDETLAEVTVHSTASQFWTVTHSSHKRGTLNTTLRFGRDAELQGRITKWPTQRQVDLSTRDTLRDVTHLFYPDPWIIPTCDGFFLGPVSHPSTKIHSGVFV